MGHLLRADPRIELLSSEEPELQSSFSQAESSNEGTASPIALDANRKIAMRALRLRPHRWPTGTWTSPNASSSMRNSLVIVKLISLISFADPSFNGPSRESASPAHWPA